MIVIKNKQAIAKMRTAGARLAGIMAQLNSLLVAGTKTSDIDAYVEKQMRENELVPVCKGFAGYQHATCISVNDTVVHGIPSKDITLKDGDCVSVDAVASYNGYCADMARTFFVGSGSPDAQKMKAVAQKALDIGINVAKPGVHLSDISAAIQQVVESAGFGVVRDFVGHGIGKDLHEDPQVPNFGKPGEGPLLQVGMTLAIEPMITQNSYEVRVMSDGWTVKTVDGGIAVHVEDTIAVLPDGAQVLTRE